MTSRPAARHLCHHPLCNQTPLLLLVLLLQLKKHTWGGDTSLQPSRAEHREYHQNRPAVSSKPSWLHPLIAEYHCIYRSPSANKSDQHSLKQSKMRSEPVFHIKNKMALFPFTKKVRVLLISPQIFISCEQGKIGSFNTDVSVNDLLRSTSACSNDTTLWAELRIPPSSSQKPSLWFTVNNVRFSL